METFASLRLNENKDRFIQKNTVLTDEQKQEVLDFFHSHANLEAKVNNGNWNYSIPYEEFKRVMASVDTQAKRMKKQSKELRQSNGLESLVEGTDYVIFKDTPEYVIYKPLNHKAMRIIASNMVEPKLWCESSIMTWTPKEVLPANEPMKDGLYPGAKWCVAMETAEHWDSYTDRGLEFLVVCQKISAEDCYKKFCVVLREEPHGTFIDWDSSVDASDAHLSRAHNERVTSIIRDIGDILQKENEEKERKYFGGMSKALESLRDSRIEKGSYYFKLVKDINIANRSCTLSVQADMRYGAQIESFEDALAEINQTKSIIVSAVVKEPLNSRLQARVYYRIHNLLRLKPVWDVVSRGTTIYRYNLSGESILQFPELQEELSDAVEEAIGGGETLQDKLSTFADGFNFKWKEKFAYATEASTCLRDTDWYTLIINVSPGLAKEAPEVQLMGVFVLKNDLLLDISEEESKEILSITLEDPDIDCRRADYKFACITSIDENNADRVLDKVKDTFEELAYRVDHLDE